MLGRLRRVDARDERKRTEGYPLRFRVGHHHDAAHQNDVFGMPNFMRFSARQTHEKRLKRATFNPCSNGFGVHTSKSTTWKKP